MMTYTAALNTLDLGKRNLLQIPMGVDRAVDTDEYQEAVTSMLTITQLGAAVFHAALQRPGFMQAGGVA